MFFLKKQDKTKQDKTKKTTFSFFGKNKNFGKINNLEEYVPQQEKELRLSDLKKYLEDYAVSLVF